jgi:hypothetical protein
VSGVLLAIGQMEIALRGRGGVGCDRLRARSKSPDRGDLSMRTHGVTPLLLAASLALLSGGCGQKSSSGSSEPGASSAPGTVVRQPLGASSAAGSVKPAPTTR